MNNSYYKIYRYIFSINHFIFTLLHTWEHFYMRTHYHGNITGMLALADVQF